MFQTLGFQLYTVRDLLVTPEITDAVYAEIRRLGLRRCADSARICRRSCSSSTAFPW